MASRLAILCLLLCICCNASCRQALVAFQAPTPPLRATRAVCAPISVKSSTESSLESVESQPTNRCRFCDASFASRNALFRHVRSDPTCSRLANDGKPYSHLKAPKRQKIALQFQYYSLSPMTESPDASRSEAKVAGDSLRSAVREAIDCFVSNDLKLDSCSVDIISTTQSSVSNLRHSSLSQEKGCAAAADVMILSFLAPAAVTSTDLDKEDRDRQEYFLNMLLKSVNTLLQDSAKSTGLYVKLLACKLLSSDSRLHAERSCTQRVYHYLMPIRWLPGGKELEQWWVESERNESLSASDRANHHTSRVQTRPPSDSLLMLKNALRSSESATVATSNEGHDAAGRFGTLANKIRRPWHNFAAPTLRGDASPNNEPVWRVVDRARLIRLQTVNGLVFAVLEFRGDDFLPEQVRRIVGTALAMTHGWLPSETFEMLTRRDVFIEAPLAPQGHLYLAAARFHFDELRMSGQGIFDTEAEGPVVNQEDKVCDSIQQHLLIHLQDETVHRQEELWLQDLQDEIAPQIRERLVDASRESLPTRLDTTDGLVSAPDCFCPALASLRDVVASGKWPATSAARSNVIREANAQRGSFTVVNPKFQNGIYSKTVDDDPLPLGNKLFPELVEAVFQLELSLSEQELDCATADGIVSPKSSHKKLQRPASSHCAINCNAEFTPHVDSGRGAGQSLSMIVGLGDYVGGELAVEGRAHEIRYRPLEFDGWKLRHWTLPFAGERFSLVWFTPEVKGKE